MMALWPINQEKERIKRDGKRETNEKLIHGRDWKQVKLFDDLVEELTRVGAVGRDSSDVEEEVWGLPVG